MNHKILASCISVACVIGFAGVQNTFANDVMALRGSNVENTNSEYNYQYDIIPDVTYPDIEQEISWFSRSKTSPTIRYNTLLSDRYSVGGLNIGVFIDDSLRNSDMLRGSLHDSKAAVEAKKAAVFALFPTINFEARKSRSVEISTFGTSLIDRTTITTSINGNWNIFSSGAGIASVRAANFTALSADMQYLSNERRVVVEAVGVYLQLLASQKLKASLHGAMSRMEKILRATRARYKAGFASRTNVAQVENEIADIELQLSQATTNLNQSHVKWTALTGKKASNQLFLPYIGQLLPASKAATIEKALRSNPVILGAQLSAQAAQQQVTIASARFLPNVSLYGNIDFGSSGVYSSTQENEWSVGAKLTVPLVNLAATSQYRQARETAHASKYRARDQKRMVKKEVETNWVRLNSFKRRSVILHNKIDAQYIILEGVGKEVNAGLRPLGDQLREETKFAQSQIDLIQNDLSKIATAFQIAIHFDDFTLASIR